MMSDPSDERLERVSYHLQIIAKNLFPDSLLKEGVMEDYYRATGWAYRFFHSKEGAIHMAINPSGVFDPKGYRIQASRVGEYLTPGMKVLELGAGAGFNTDILSKENPDVSFLASDITPSQVERMKERFRGRSNVEAERIDYQSIPRKDESFDLVFLVETLCHSPNFKEALLEMKRVLKPGGTLIVFDAFATPLSDEGVWQEASRQAMRSMAVDQGWYIDDFLEFAQENFTLLRDDDYSKEIMPCLWRLQSLAWRFLRRPRLVLVTKRLLPLVAQNSIAGLLMADLFASGAWDYRSLVLRKEE
jgi:ubiquinone/menaquinone biosynthesis C-methylase UbiE